MAGTIEGIRLHNGGEAVLFGFRHEGRHVTCVVSREVVIDLEGSNSRGDGLLADFRKHADTIAAGAEKAIGGGLAGDPLLIPDVMFSPYIQRGR